MERKFRARVGAHLIVKNESENIQNFFPTFKGLYDEGCLCVTDTGSTDDTVEQLKKAGANVGYFEWCQNFGKARNASLDFLYETCPDIDVVVWWDADDKMLSEDDVIKFREIIDRDLDNPNIECWNFAYIYTHEEGTLGNQSLANFKYHRLRAFKKGKARWKMPIHEYLESDGRKHINCSEVEFHHFRNGTGEMNNKRNLDIFRKIMKDATPEELPRLTFYKAKECTYCGLWEEAIEDFLTYIPMSNWVPEKHRAMYELASAYKQLNDLEKSRYWAFQAITLNPAYPDPYMLLALIAYGEKDWKMTAAWASMIPQLGPTQTNFFDFIPTSTYAPQDLMAVAYYYLGEVEKGKEAITKALSYKPHDKRFLFNWTQFYKTDKIAIIIPTYNREEKLNKCIELIKENSITPNYEILVGVDANQAYYERLGAKYIGDPKVKLYNFPNKSGAISIVNNLVDITDAKYVTYIGDDVEVLPGFLIHAYVACEDKNLVSYNDNVWNGEIAAHWFAPKDLREKLGGVFFHESYKHVGCDNELTIKAKKLNLYTFAKNAMINHVHWIKGNCSDKTKVAEYDDCYKIGWDEANVKYSRKLLDIRTKNNFLSDLETLNISIGSGHKKYNGYVSLDKFSNEADIKKDIFEEGLFNPETVDNFIAEHLLEHFTSQEGYKFMSICYSALKVGGRLEIAVPDMSKIQDIEDVDYRIKVMYGWQLPGMRHCWGYTMESLVDLFEKIGFIVTEKVETFEYDAPAIRIIGQK